MLGCAEVLRAGPEVVAEAVRHWLEHAKGRHVRLLEGRVRPPGREGHGGPLVACRLGRLLDRRAPAEHDEVRHRDLVAALAVEGGLDLAVHAEHRGQLRRAVHLPVLLWCEADARPVGAAAMVSAAVGGGGRPSDAHELGHITRLQDLALELRDLGDGDRDAARLGHRVLPQLHGRHVGTEAARAWSHVAMGQLVPGLGEGLLECALILGEALRDREVAGVDAQREVRREHHRCVRLGSVMRIGHRACRARVRRRPLRRACRASGLLPLIPEEVLEVAHVPRDGVSRPRALEARK
mmetsp:Transcript_34032/g.80905  ORF Transcript_34032/g.80905 Transcript_34032/m.80905 type:complete len:295 (+) Transcript_34032:703-1587(+)